MFNYHMNMFLEVLGELICLWAKLKGLILKLDQICKFCYPLF